MEENAKKPEVLEDIEEKLNYCEKLVSSEVRLHVALLILEELLEEFKRIEDKYDEELIKVLSDRARLLYHRAKALLSLQEDRSAYRQFED